jgi:predicted CopG family antitoxin
MKKREYGFVRISDETWKELKTMKEKSGMSIRRIIEKILAHYRKTVK